MQKDQKIKAVSCSFSLEEKEPKELSKNMLRIFGRAPAQIQPLDFGIDYWIEPLQHFSRPGEIRREGSRNGDAGCGDEEGLVQQSYPTL